MGFCRAMGYEDVPYILSLDANVNPDESEVLKSVIASSYWIDVHAVMARSERRPVANTFCRQGIKCGAQGKGITRIDGIFLNKPAADLIGRSACLYSLPGGGLDHAVLVVDLTIDHMQAT